MGGHDDARRCSRDYCLLTAVLENIFHRLVFPNGGAEQLPFSSGAVNTESRRYHVIVGKFFSGASLPDASIQVRDKQKTK